MSKHTLDTYDFESRLKIIEESVRKMQAVVDADNRSAIERPLMNDCLGIIRGNLAWFRKALRSLRGKAKRTRPKPQAARGADVNKFGVPYHGYELTLASGEEILIDVADESDWGNIQQCFTDWNGKQHRECVGWGSEEKWTEITDVYDCETEDHLDPLAWARENVWCYVENYSG